MSPPTTDGEKLSKNDVSKQLALTNRNSMYARLQTIYNLSKLAESDSDSCEAFLSSCINIDTIRTEFNAAANRYYELELTTNPKADHDKAISAFNAFEDLYCRVKYVFNKLSAVHAASITKPGKATIRLPALEIMSFDGNIRSWPLFYSNFKSVIHDNQSLTDSEKMYYLISKISPKAQAVFAGLAPSGENYNLILDALIKRYEDKRTLASAHLSSILNHKLCSAASISTFESFLDNFVSAVNGLKNVGLKDVTDFIILNLALKRLDSETVRAFELSCRGIDIPSFDTLVEFVKDQMRIMQNTDCTVVNKKPSRPLNTFKPPQPQSYVTLSNAQKCLCSNMVHDHLFKCPAFADMTSNDRFKRVKELNACVNCLSTKHRAGDCHSDSVCKKCRQRHHTMLHFEGSGGKSNAASKNADEATFSKCLVSHSDHPLVAPASTEPFKTQSTILLATAVVLVTDDRGRAKPLRCLLDSASETNFITTDGCRQVGIKCDMAGDRPTVKGIGGVSQTVKGSASFSFSSRYDSSIKYDITALVLDRITDNLPSSSVKISALPHVNNLPLADDSFAVPGRIDVIIGAGLFPHLILPHVVQHVGLPPAIDTVLGYVIMGSVPTLRANTHNKSPHVNCCVVPQTVANEPPVDELLKMFWQVEESPLRNPPTQSLEDMECDHFYRETTVREEGSGRYCVALPFRSDVYSLGDSLPTARRRFFSLEKRLESSCKLRAAYDDSIREYLEKGYLSPAPLAELNSQDASYVIPHHAIIRENGKFRSVLDASSKTSSGVALNDILHAGPNLQGDLFTIILNYRLFPIALSADCKQMFLQIAVRESDRRFQRILYRFNPKDPLTVYQFNRVCFGLKSSPYHALKTVKTLISDEGDSFPTAREVASSSIYMDDAVFSQRDEKTAITASRQLIQLFKRGQFDLIKWTSNSRAVLDSIPASHRSSDTFEFDKPAEHKILGLRWSQTEDCFEFNIAPLNDKVCTKRSILSEVAKLWDIIGFTAPVILFAKLLIKQLWLLKLDWDDSPPQHVVDAWRRFRVDLPKLNTLRIPRHLGVFDGSLVRLVGFADASQSAYGGVIYAHVTRGVEVTVNLVCAKSKVAPVKPLSIARLELCAAELMSRLLRQVYDTYHARYNIAAVYAFTDSKVVLCWLNASPHRWQTFVANRVVKTTDNIPAEHFYHVAGSENPADCLSRGLEPNNLIDHPLWFHGPLWLQQNPQLWPINKVDETEEESVPEEKLHVYAVASSDVSATFIQSLSERVSSWSRLLRIVIFVLRFLRKLPRRETHSTTAMDLESAEQIVLEDVQRRHFSDVSTQLRNDKESSTSLRKLKPFIRNNLILVGGRLGFSAESYNRKHPIVLPRRDRIIELLIDYSHRKFLHAGPELLMAKLREKYWILSARCIIRQRIHLCNACHRLKPRPGFTPIMGDLPEFRVKAADKAFSHTGCDYAGPIQYTPCRGRGVRSKKAYLCIFTCLSTRAIHIEVATDLSTVSFVGALKRFLSRRGPVQCMYSDNGTNFVGTKSYLRDLYEFLNKEYRPRFEEELAESRIDWKFIPPASPHFGGCWEAMVKCVKTHLFKVIGQQVLSYEELVTTLTQIECLLNSRPLTVLSADPSEPTALTPAHFLNTAPLLSFPAPEVSNAVNQIVQRHTLLDKLVQSFWKRWRNEYLYRLQIREKWNTASAPIKKGMVVIIINENSPPLSWPLAIVHEVYPAKDGQIRVVAVRTARGILIRPVSKLSPIPTQ